MTAPVASARQTPTGIHLDDGFSTKITFAANPSIPFWEKTVQPPGMEGGDPIDTTTMFNSVWRTMASRGLKTLTETTITAAYNPNANAPAQIQSLVNLETTITVTYPDGSTLAFYGYLKTWEPQSHEEGAQPEVNLTIQPTNQDPNTRTEEAPVYVDVPGT